MVRILDRECNTILNKFMAQLRDAKVQTDSMRFRRNLERVGEVMAYEISKTLSYAPRIVETPLGEAEVAMIDDRVVVATILRAGLPFHQGFLNYFDDAQNAFVSAYRKYTDETHFDVEVEYLASPRLEGKTVLLVDTMLATGCSALLAYKALLTKGTPAKLVLASVIASQEAVERLQNADLLIIDDLGVERNSDFAREQVFSVIDSRHRSQLPMIVTTNLTPKEMKNPADLSRARIYDRVLERCTPIRVDNQNIRERNKADNLKKSKQLLGAT